MQSDKIIRTQVVTGSEREKNTEEKRGEDNKITGLKKMTEDGDWC